MKEKEGELHLRFRPRTFEEFIGSEAIKESIQSGLHRTHTYLFTGLRGTGKTTLARLISYALGAGDRDIVEIDAADRTGVDDARELKSTLQYAPMQGKVKVYIIDEVHRLTGNAQDSLLKTLEEPPDHVYFILCTTDVNKLASTIRSRAKEYELQPFNKDNAGKVIDWICAEEKIELHAEVRKLLIQRCEGIPRELIVNLDKVRDIEDLEKVKELIQSASEKAEVLDLCRLLVKGGTWLAVREVLSGIKEDPEAVRRAALGYLGRVLLNSDKGQAKRISDIIFLFSGNLYDGGRAELYASCYLATLV